MHEFSSLQRWEGVLGVYMPMGQLCEMRSLISVKRHTGSLDDSDLCRARKVRVRCGGPRIKSSQVKSCPLAPLSRTVLGKVTHGSLRLTHKDRTDRTGVTRTEFRNHSFFSVAAFYSEEEVYALECRRVAQAAGALPKPLVIWFSFHRASAANLPCGFVRHNSPMCPPWPPSTPIDGRRHSRA